MGSEQFHIGDLGHIFVILSFVSALFGGVAYFISTFNKDLEEISWKTYARALFVIHGLSILGVVVVLFSIIHSHDYRYHYAWSHSSNDLPVHYMISCFWEGQEGSFLLWIFWHVILGLFLVFRKSSWEGPVMSIFMLVQVFLTSMILGVVLGDLKIGSSPFIMLREVFYDAPIFLDNPNHMPLDGNGLNPLLQNYWMVIHPPTLFLGFALTMIPFAFCMAGLWKRRFDEWVRPALSWSLVSAGILGTGIIMGGFWAYETLNFGGYWNWDPVENAVYIPWMIQIAAIHTMVLYQRTKGSLMFSVVMVCLTFILILYSTFLTRSGILGESSVHAFTDLGLMGQLLMYLLGFVLLTVVMIIARHKTFPYSKKEITVYTKDFWVLAGMIVLILGAFQVFMGTSIPVFNSLFGLKLAPPTDAPVYYSKIQIWFGLFTAVCAGMGQYIWWAKSDKGQLKSIFKWFWMVLGLTFVIGMATILFMEFGDEQQTKTLLFELRSADGDRSWLGFIGQLISYILLLAFALFSVVSSAFILKKLWTTKSLSGGALSHIGFALMLIGILFSSGYSRVISKNLSGRIYSKEFSTEMNTENVLLWSYQDQKMAEYDVSYNGKRLESPDYPGFLNLQQVFPSFEENTVIATDTIKWKGEVYFNPGDSIRVSGENMYYEVAYAEDGEHQFTLFPRAQNNPNMGFIASPDISRQLTRDLYTHVASVPDPDGLKWSEEKEQRIQKDQPLIVNDYVGKIDSIKQIKFIPGVTLPKGSLAIKTYLSFELKNGKRIRLEPALIISSSGKSFSTIEISHDLGIKIRFAGLNPDNGVFSFFASETQKDYIILKVVEKPLINILWIGTIITVLGFGIAARRRFIENKSQAKD